MNLIQYQEDDIYLIFRKVYPGLCDAWFSDWFDKQTGASYEVLLIQREPGFILRENNKVWPATMSRFQSDSLGRLHTPDYRQTCYTGLSESSIPYWQHAISKFQYISDNTFVRFVEQERLSPLCVDVGVGSEERRERSNVIPSHKHLIIGIPKETAHISCRSYISRSSEKEVNPYIQQRTCHQFH
jgi:hypothetical protein